MSERLAIYLYAFNPFITILPPKFVNCLKKSQENICSLWEQSTDQVRNNEVFPTPLAFRINFLVASFQPPNRLSPSGGGREGNPSPSSVPQ
jgi:hypothetical protein